MRVRLQFSLALAFGLCGCAPVYLQGQAKYDYEEGWREGIVTHFVEGGEIASHATVDCRSELPPDRAGKTRFALVKFSNARNMHSQIVPVAPTTPVAVGDTVLVKMNDCSQPGLAFSRK